MFLLNLITKLRNEENKPNSNLNGVLVATIVNQSVLAPGHHVTIWDASYIGSEIYFVEFIAGTTRKIQKITMLK